MRMKHEDIPYNFEVGDTFFVLCSAASVLNKNLKVNDDDDNNYYDDEEGAFREYKSLHLYLAK